MTSCDGSRPRASVANSIWALFAETVVRQALSRRLIVLAVLYALPIVFAVLMRQNDSGFNGPTAVTQVGKTAWVLEGKLKYMNDPKFKDQDPGPFKAYAVPIPGNH